MKTNKILAVALSAGLVLGGASYAHAGGSASVPTEEGQPATREDLQKKLEDAKAELNNAEAELAEANAQLQELWAEAGNAGSDDDTDGNAEEFDKLNAEIKKLEEEVAAAKAKVQEAEKELALADKKTQYWVNASFQIRTLEGKWKTLPGAVIEVSNEKGEVVHTFTTEEERVETKLPEGNYTATVVSVPLDEGTYEWKEPMTYSFHNGPASIAFHVYEKKKTQTLDDWQIEQNEKDGYFTEEDAKRAGELALDKAELRGLYEVEVRKNAAGDRWFWRFVPVEKAEEEKPDIPWTPLEPAEPIPEPGTPWTPLTPADPIVPGGDNEVVIPGEKPEDKPEDNKGTEIEEEKPNEGKDKDEKAKPSKEKAKPAKQKGNNPKTGLVGLAPIYSTLAISMAGIVAARKKND